MIRPLCRFFVAITLLLALVALPASAKAPKLRDLADTVAANPILTRFSQVIAASDLGTFLSSKGPFTLFVPTDAAFDKLSPGTMDLLLKPENKVRLQNILLFHVVNGKKLTAKDLLALKSLLSCQGAPLTVKLARTGAQFVQKGKIVHADIHCQNGIIHEVDTVLMPPESALPPLVTPAPPPPPVVQSVPVAGTTTDHSATDTTTPPADSNATVVPTAPTDTNAPPRAEPASPDNGTNAPPMVFPYVKPSSSPAQ